MKVARDVSELHTSPASTLMGSVLDSMTINLYDDIYDDLYD